MEYLYQTFKNPFPSKGKKKEKKGVKQSLLQAWTGREGSRRSRLPDFKTVGT